MTRYRLLSILVLGGFFACGDASRPPETNAPDASAGSAGTAGSAGNSAIGGAAGSGGSSGSGATGGTSASGGSSGAGATGGTTGSGGSGGSAAAGGSTSTGGNAGSGATGGTTSTGGSAGSGATGGAAGSGTGGSGTAGTSGHDGGPIDVHDVRSDSHLRCDATKRHPVSFRMIAMDGFAYYLDVCIDHWLKILPLDGGQPLQVLPSWCTEPCDQCIRTACDAVCTPPVTLPPSGFTYAWDGELWEKSFCRTDVTCDNGVCLAPGRYIARMCGTRRDADAGCAPFCAVSKCVDVPFDYPATAPVEGVLR